MGKESNPTQGPEIVPPAAEVEQHARNPAPADGGQGADEVEEVEQRPVAVEDVVGPAEG